MDRRVDVLCSDADVYMRHVGRDGEYHTLRIAYTTFIARIVWIVIYIDTNTMHFHTAAFGAFCLRYT